MLVMDTSEVEEHLSSIGEPKLHGGMCSILSAIHCRVIEIFPELEAARPRSTSGIQALCSLHIALEKTKIILQHCAECSKLYLAITGDSVVTKIERARSALIDSLRRLEEIVPQEIAYQISEIVGEFEAIEFSVDPLEKQVGDDLIALLQQGRQFNRNGDDMNELQSFHQVAFRLGITSSGAALKERTALKKLIERARVEEDKRKESIVAYLSHLMRKYSKSFKADVLDNNSQCSTPCSPNVQGSFEGYGGLDGNGHTFDQKLSKHSSFNFKPNVRRLGQITVPPEELKCPISLQLMYDPVIIASGQTYERICIEKWFHDGHNTCPKTQQELSHLCLIPNYCVKGLVTSWCEQNGFAVPDGPPESLDLNYWRLAMSEGEDKDAKLMDTTGSCKLNGLNIDSIEKSAISEEVKGNEVESVYTPDDEPNGEVDTFKRYDEFLTVLNKEQDLSKKCKVVEEVRHLLRDGEEARIYMGRNGFIEALISFLRSAVREKDEMAQDMGAMALFNLAVNNNRNKEVMLAAGVLPLLGKMIADSRTLASAVALYLNLSCLEEAKPIIASSQAVKFLVKILEQETNTQCKCDALHALYNLSSLPSNTPHLLSGGIINSLLALMKNSEDSTWTEKSIAVLTNLILNKSSRNDIISSPGLISELASILDIGEPLEQEQAAACLLMLCDGNDKCIQMVLQEGVIPSLVSIAVNGTMRAKSKCQKLLTLFREQRQKEPAQLLPREQADENEMSLSPEEPPKPLSKSISRRVLGRNLSFWWKNKSFTVYR
ncbi:hypothetical protein ACET3Z_030387 [Daucus carota]